MSSKTFLLSPAYLKILNHNLQSCRGREMWSGSSTSFRNRLTEGHVEFSKPFRWGQLDGDFDFIYVYFFTLLRNSQGCAKEGKIDLQISTSPIFRNISKGWLKVSYEDVRNSFWSPDDVWVMYSGFCFPPLFFFPYFFQEKKKKFLKILLKCFL